MPVFRTHVEQSGKIVSGTGRMGILLHLAHDFFKLKGEQRSGRDDGDGVCDRLGEEYREHIILHELRKDEDQRDEDDDLAEDSEEGADLGIAESDECLLAGNLDAHQEDGGHVDAQRPDGDLAQLRLIGKDGDEQ